MSDNTINRRLIKLAGNYLTELRSSTDVIHLTPQQYQNITDIIIWIAAQISDDDIMSAFENEGLRKLAADALDLLGFSENNENNDLISCRNEHSDDIINIAVRCLSCYKKHTLLPEQNIWGCTRLVYL